MAMADLSVAMARLPNARAEFEVAWALEPTATEPLPLTLEPGPMEIEKLLVALAVYPMATDDWPPLLW